MAISNYWESEFENFPGAWDSGGSPVGDPVDGTPAPMTTRTRPPKPSSAGLLPGTEWRFNEQYWTWETKPVAGYVPPGSTDAGATGGPKSGDRRPSPKGDQYFEQFNGTTWVTYDAPGGGGGGDVGGTGAAGMGAIGDMLYKNIGPAPAFNAPRYKSPGAFTWDKPDAFQAPDAQAVFEDPGFQTRLDLGKKAIENSASARGASRAGATYKGLIDYAETMGSQEYGQVYGRRASEYDRTYRNAFEDAVTGYGFLLSDADKQFQTDMAATGAEYQPQFATWQADFERERDQTNLDWTRTAFGSDNDFRNNSLVASILQTILNAGRPSKT